MSARVVLHVLKVFMTCSLIMFAFWGAVAGIAALTSEAWRDRLTSHTHKVTVTVVGEERNWDGLKGCALPGWEWLVTWQEGGETNHGRLTHCGHAPPTGTQLDTYVTDSGEAEGDSTRNYLIGWPIASVLPGAGLTLAWLTGRGSSKFRAIRRRT